MPRYLLGSQCVLDIAKRIGCPPEQWFLATDKRGINARDVYISAVTPMILASAFARVEQTPDIAAIRANSDKLITRFDRAGRIAPVTKEIADRWGELLEFDLTYETADGETKLYRFHQKLVLATAIEGLDGRPFTLVDKRQKAHQDLESLGLVLEDPHDMAFDEDAG